MAFSWIPGVELWWLACYVLARILARRNAPPPHRLDRLLENLYLWVPLAAFLSFSLWFVPVLFSKWLLLRLWIAGLVGTHLTLDTGLIGHSQQGPGIGTAYIAGWGLGFFALLAGTIVVWIWG